MTHSDVAYTLQILAERQNKGEDTKEPFFEILKHYILKHSTYPEDGILIETKNVIIEAEIEHSPTTIIGLKVELMNSEEDWIELDTDDFMSSLEIDLAANDADNAESARTERLLSNYDI